MCWFKGLACNQFLSCNVCRFALSAVDMELRDYDSRSALHLAAAEGKQLSHMFSIRFFFYG